MLEDLDLVLVRQLLQHVRQALDIQCGDHGGAALGGEVVEHVGRVGGSHLVQGRDQVSGALRRLTPDQSDHVAPLHDVGLAPASKALAGLLHGDPAEHPVTGSHLLHRDVVDGAGDPLVARTVLMVTVRSSS